MSTNDQFAVANLKSLWSFEDWGTYFLDYMRESTRKGNLARWNVDGVFDPALTLSGPSAGTVRVNGSSWATDGLGHILDIAAATTRDATFENVNAITYYVALFYAEAPSEVRPSPRTGVIQYVRKRELIGRSADPNSVINNGNGTLTFVVDSVLEAGIPSPSRTVRVFKKVPGPNASTIAIAVEDRTVAWNGSNNRITTTGIFGQTGTPSTTAADYTVICLGPTVTRNEDLRNTSGAAFIGTITGNGGTPSTFSTADQRILKSFDDSTQVLYTPAAPALWPDPDPTTVKGALDKIVSMYADAITSGLGASLIGNLALTGTWADGNAVIAGTVRAQLNDLLAALGSSTAGTKKISSAQLPNWEDGTFVPAGSLFSQLEGIINAFTGADGDSKIGAEAKEGTPISLIPTRLSFQIQLLLDEVNKIARFFTPTAVAKNWLDPVTIANTKHNVVVWNPGDKYWYTFGGDGVNNPQGQRTINGHFGTFVSLTIPAGSTLIPICAAANPAGIMIVGGNAGTATTKIRESSNGTTWTARNTVAGSGANVNSAIWVAGAGLFVIGLSNAAATNIETSTNGQTWTQRTAPNTHVRGPMATNGSIVVMLSTDSVGVCITSTDCITWTERSLGSTTTWKGVVYDADSGLFFAFRDGGFAWSSNGTTWIDPGTSMPFSMGGNAYPTMGVINIRKSIVVYGVGDNQIWAGYFDNITPKFYLVNGQADNTIHGAAGDGAFMVTTDSALHKTFAGGV